MTLPLPIFHTLRTRSAALGFKGGAGQGPRRCQRGSPSHGARAARGAPGAVGVLSLRFLGGGQAPGAREGPVWGTTDTWEALRRVFPQGFRGADLSEALTPQENRHRPGGCAEARLSATLSQRPVSLLCGRALGVPCAPSKLRSLTRCGQAPCLHDPSRPCRSQQLSAVTPGALQDPPGPSTVALGTQQCFSRRPPCRLPRALGEFRGGDADGDQPQKRRGPGEGARLVCACGCGHSPCVLQPLLRFWPWARARLSAEPLVLPPCGEPWCGLGGLIVPRPCVGYTWGRAGPRPQDTGSRPPLCCRR